MYSNNFVVSILVDGIPQKELADGSVVLPFGTEYVIRLRNKHRHSRALAHVTIDGESVSGGGIVVEANDKVDLERNVWEAWKFKFVSLDSSEAVDYGKNGPNTDRSRGVIEVHWRLEEKPLAQISTPKSLYRQWHDYSAINCQHIVDPNTLTNSKTLTNPYTYTSGYSGLAGDPSGFEANYDAQCVGGVTYNAASTSAPIVQDLAPQDGCTVPGSSSDQEFTTTSFHASKDKTTIRVILRGVQYDVIRPSLAAKNYCDKSLAQFKKSNKDYGKGSSKEPNPSSKDSSKDLNKDLQEQIRAAERETLELELQILELKKGKLQQELEKLKA